MIKWKYTKSRRFLTAVAVAFGDTFNFSIESAGKRNVRASESERNNGTVRRREWTREWDSGRKSERVRVRQIRIPHKNPTDTHIASIFFAILLALNIKTNYRMTFLKWKYSATEIPFAPPNKISKMWTNAWADRHFDNSKKMHISIILSFNVKWCEGTAENATVENVFASERTSDWCERASERAKKGENHDASLILLQ